MTAMSETMPRWRAVDLSDSARLRRADDRSRPVQRIGRIVSHAVVAPIRIVLTRFLGLAKDAPLRRAVQRSVIIAATPNLYGLRVLFTAG